MTERSAPRGTTSSDTVPTGRRPQTSPKSGSNGAGSSSAGSNGTSGSNGRPQASASDDTAVRDQSTVTSPPVIPPPPPAPAGKAAKPAKAPKAPKAPREKKASVVPRDDGTTTASRPKATRRARLRLTRVDPWSVMKTAFLLSIAFGVVTVVSVAMVWQVLGAAGVWDSINQTIQETIGGSDTSTFDVQDYVGTSRVLGFTMLVAAVDVVLLTAVATLGAFLYNMAAALLGGLEITLAEDPH